MHALTLQLLYNIVQKVVVVHRGEVQSSPFNKHRRPMQIVGYYVLCAALRSEVVYFLLLNYSKFHKNKV